MAPSDTSSGGSSSGSRPQLLRDLYPSEKVLIPFVGHLTMKEATEKLAISETYLIAVLKGEHTPSRAMVMRNDWWGALITLHPEADKGDMERLFVWLTAITGKHVLNRFVGHMPINEIENQLGISAATINSILTERTVTHEKTGRTERYEPSRQMVMANDLKQVIPLLHPNVTKGLPVPEKDLQELRAWLDGIIGTHPLTPYIGRLPVNVAAEALGIDYTTLTNIVDHGQTSERRTIMANDWLEVLSALHPNAEKGEPVPEAHERALHDWLKPLLGDHVLHRFTGHLTQDAAAQRLGLDGGQAMHEVLSYKWRPSTQKMGASNWRNELLMMKPDATAGDMIDLDRWMLTRWQARSPARIETHVQWRAAVGEVFRAIRLTTGKEIKDFVFNWDNSTRAGALLKASYAQLETGEVTRKTTSLERQAYLRSAREVCRLAGVTKDWAATAEARMERITGLSASADELAAHEKEKPLFEAYRRLLSLFPPLTPTGGQLPVLGLGKY